MVCEILRKFDIDSLYICPPYLYTVTTLPWEIQKSHFSTVLLIEFLWSVFLSLWSVIFKATNATHNRLFSESPTFGGTQHYLQSDVKVLHFTR